MSGDISGYTDLVVPEHAGAANFMAALSAVLQPVADGISALSDLPGLYDVDTAVGDQLDTVGLWVGVSRNIALPLTDIYFAFDQVNVGFDQGVWFERYDPITNQFALPDDHYRLLIYAKIAANQWDGSIPGAYAAWAKLFSPGNTVLIQDGGDMTMTIGFLGPLPDALTTALLTGGYLSLKPAGVHINGYFAPSIGQTPFFGFDVETMAISGFDVGSWGEQI